MSKVNTGQASSTLIPKYIGSDFDKVVAVANNIDQVVVVSDNIEDVGTVADNINYVKEVAEDLHGMPVTMYTGENPPVLNPMPEGVMWYCTTDGRTYVWYTDADSGQWVESAPQSALQDEATNIFFHSTPSNVSAAYRNATLFSTPAPEAEISVAHNALNTPVLQAQFIREEALWVDVSVTGAQGIVTLMGYSSGYSQLKAEIITWKNGAEGTSLGTSQWVTLPSQPSVVSMPVTLANIDVLDAGDSYIVRLTSQMNAGGSAVSTILVDGNTSSRFGIIFNTNLIGLNDGIRDGVTTSAPTENAVYDALQLKADKTEVSDALQLKVEKSQLAAPSGAGLVGGLEVTAESFGVVSGLVSLPVARTNAYKIMNKAAELSAAGGGKIIFTKPLYQVHMDEADFSSSAATLRVAALKIPFDNVILCGQGWTATTIQAYATNSAYGVVQWTETPQENGITKVKGVGLHDICIDGNYHGDFTPGSYVRQLEGVLGAGIEGLNISRLKVKNCSHYGMGLQNGGYKGCSIDGYWSENTGADGIDIKDNGSVSRAFQLNNIFVFNFGQLNEPLNPWAGVDIMSVAPKVSNVYVSDFGDKGAPGAGVRIKQGPIGDPTGRGTGGVWANITNITVVQNRFGVTKPIRGLHIKSPFVNYSNIVTIGYDGGRLKTGVYIEERHTKGSNVQIANAENGVMITGSTSGSAEGREYGDGDDAAIVGITCRDVLRAFDLQRKYTKLVAVTLKDCAVGFDAGGSRTGPVTIKGLHLDGVTDPFGQMGGSFHKITDVTGPDSVNWQAGIGILKSATDFVATAILSRLSVRLYTGSTDSAVGTEVARFMPASSTVFSPLVVAGNVQSSAPNTNTVGTGPTPWAGAFFQAAPTITSDERYKTTPLDITDAMLDAAAEVDWVRYQYIDRVEAKGPDGARWHFGAVAQRFVEAFRKHGLDAHDYGFLCYDEWEGSEAVIDEETGAVVTPAIEPGNRYGIRYEEVLALEAALQRRNHQRLLARIEALESK